VANVATMRGNISDPAFAPLFVARAAYPCWCAGCSLNGSLVITVYSDDDDDGDHIIVIKDLYKANTVDRC